MSNQCRITVYGPRRPGFCRSTALLLVTPWVGAHAQHFAHRTSWFLPNPSLCKSPVGTAELSYSCHCLFPARSTPLLPFVLYQSLLHPTQVQFKAPSSTLVRLPCLLRPTLVRSMGLRNVSTLLEHLTLIHALRVPCRSLRCRPPPCLPPNAASSLSYLVKLLDKPTLSPPKRPAPSVTCLAVWPGPEVRYRLHRSEE